MQKTTYDIVVVGAGPAGSYLAYLLAKRGCEVLVLEKEPRIGKPTCCTGIVSRDCLSTVPLDDGVVLRETNTAVLFSPSGRSLTITKDATRVCILDRHAFDLKLADMAEKEGAQFQLGAMVTDISRNNGHLEVLIEQRGKSPSSVTGRGVAIASGFGSSLPQKLGMGRAGDFVAGAQVEVRLSETKEVEVYFDQDLTDGFFAWLVPLSGDRGLAGLFSKHHPGLRLQDFLDRLSRSGKIVSRMSDISYGAVPLEPLSKTHSDGIVVLGDAAGQVKPTTGGGIYYGLLCAEMAARSLVQATDLGNYSASILSGYETAWRKRLAWELKIGYWARSFYKRLANSQIDSLFRLAQEQDLHRWLLEGQGFSFDWHGPLIRKALSHQSIKTTIPVLFKTVWRK